ncbi:MAG: protein translocase subunit SecD [Deltaproteobacteria bacterium]|nr:protein translocase subunit SecD [Deltaproteobacteria bacterium]
MTVKQQQQSFFYGALLLISLMILAPNFIAEYLPTWWPGKKINLGLDLKGGSYLVLSVQTEEAVKSQLGQIAGSINNDLKKAGVVRGRQLNAREIELTSLGDRALVEIENLVRKNYPELTKGEIKNEGNRYKVTYRISEDKAETIKKDSVMQAIETVRSRVDYYGVTEPVIQRAGADRIMIQLPNVTDLEAVKKTIGSVAKLEFRLVYEASRTSPETASIKFPQKEGGEIALEDDVLMTGDVIEHAAVEISPQNNQPEVTLRLNSIGKGVFDRITGANVGRQLAIVLDKVVQSAPEIKVRIGGGSAVISGSFTKQEAKQLAVVLRSGALPAPLKHEEERTVGAALGSDSIKAGMIASIVSAIVVICFMAVYYGRSGILANACLILNITFLLASLALFGATLTLPGIAGLALTLGMAVDANVIIYERIREEIRNGASATAAIAAGFNKAHWTILDANLTTLLSGLVLFAFGTGPIRGFAVTLSLGIITTLITALYVNKFGFDIFKLRNSKGELSI